MGARASCTGGEDKATVTGRISGRSLALSGGSCSGDRMPTGQRKKFLQRGRVMATRRGYGAHQRPVALCAWAGQA